MAGLLWRTFEYIDEEMFMTLYKTMVRSHLEYAAPVWSPHTWKLAEELEKVQRRATKRIPSLANLEYEERLRQLKLPTLVYRRLRGDMINVYKYLNKIYDTETCLLPQEKNDRTRGHQKKLRKQQGSKLRGAEGQNAPKLSPNAPRLLNLGAKFCYPIQTDTCFVA